MERDTYQFTKNGVKIATQSGMVQGSKSSHYIKWLMGWIDGGGWSGATTIEKAFDRAKQIKPVGCSWHALGYLMATEQNFKN